NSNSTNVSMAAMALLKATSYGSKMATVNVSYLRKASAPNSASMCNATNTAPPARAGRKGGSVTRANVGRGPEPKEREVSSRAGSMLRNAAATDKCTSGQYENFSTSAAPKKPSIRGRMDIQL